MRVWFERELVVFPYGDDATRKKVNIILDELEAHVWKNGDIVDVGKHNDTVMAFAHAIDQFKPKTNDLMPMISKKTSMGGWGTKGNKKPKGINRRPSKGKYVRL